VEAKLNQFAIRNSQFAITFCDGDLDLGVQFALPSLGRGLKPPKFVKKRNLLLYVLILNKYETIEALRQLKKRESARQTLRKNSLWDF
jgi:hypothetical protein